MYNANRNIIYSRNTYNNTIEKCCTFLKFCKEEFNVKNLEDIKSVYFTQFVIQKQYKKNTANSYACAVKKLESIYTAKNNNNCVWVNDEYKNFVNNTEQARKQMSREIHDKIIEQAYKNKFVNGLAFDITRALGLRVSEITNLRKKDFKYDKDNHLISVYIYCSKRAVGIEKFCQNI